jgi:DNA-binding transcriptional regulator YdaS (Cro superfamily)
VVEPKQHSEVTLWLSGDDVTTGIQEAVDVVGGQAAMAAALGVSQPAVSAWVVRGYAPIDRIAAIAELSGVERRRLCDPHIIEVIDPE